MCDTDRLSVILLTAEAAVIVAMGLIVAAMGANVSFVAAFAAPGLMTGASIALAVAIAALSAAAGQSVSCTAAQVCAADAAGLSAALVGLIAVLSVTLTAIVVATFASSIPVLGAVALPALVASLAAQLLLWPTVARQILLLAACMRRSTTLPNIAAFGAWAVTVVIFTVLLKGLGGGSPTCFGLRC